MLTMHGHVVVDHPHSSGPIFESKKGCHYAYKAELRRQRRSFAAEKSEALGAQLVEKNFTKFWRDWRKISQVNCPPVNRIGDAITEPDIASAFQTFFQDIYGNNGTDAHKALRDEFNSKNRVLAHKTPNF